MFYPVSDYLTLPRDSSWIVPDVLPPGGCLNIFGKPKAGKSFAALHKFLEKNKARLKLRQK